MSRSRDFVLLSVGRCISQLGTAMTVFVIPWLLLQITGSAAQTGAAFAVGFVPYILLALPAGVWADRLNRKLLMVVSDAGRFVFLLAIPLAHHFIGTTPLSVLYIVQAGVSALSAIFDAAYGASLPCIVPPEKLRGANNSLQVISSVSKIAGPILGGLAVTWVGAANTIWVDVASYLASIITVIAIRTPFSQKVPKGLSRGFMRDVKEGMRTVWDIVPIRYLMLFATLTNLVGPGMDVALLFRIQRELTLGSKWAGVIMTGLSVGMLIGGLVNRRAARRIPVGTWLTMSSMLQVVPPILLSFVTNPTFLLVIQVFVGSLLVAWNVQSVTLRQRLIPNDLLGRSSSVFRLSAWVSIPIGDALAGIISGHFGTSIYFIVSASVLFVVAILCLRLKLRDVVGYDTSTSASSQRSVVNY